MASKEVYLFGRNILIRRTEASWKNPDEWVFGFDNETCHNKCWLFELGLLEISWLKKDCKYLEL